MSEGIPLQSTPVWAERRFVILAILACCSGHFVLRFLLWPTLGLDDAEQALFAQHFAWTYRTQAPPLFTWVLLALGQMTGVNLLSISIIRYTLLAATLLFTYGAARRLLGDPRLSALSVFSFAAIYVFAYYAHHDLTHTTMMTAMLAAAWYVIVRLVATPTLGWYLALGCVTGLGLLGKWNYVMFAAALPLASALWPETRRLVLTWKVLPALAAAAAIALPTVVAVLHDTARTRSTVEGVLIDADASHLARAAEGLARLFMAVLAYPEPLLVILLLILGSSLWRGLRTAPAAPFAGRVTLRFLLSVIGVSLALHAALIVAVGATEMHERLLQPALFMLPVALLMLVERGRPSARALGIFAASLVVLVAVAFAARIGISAFGADTCGRCRANAPFAALGDSLRNEGFAGAGTILAPGFHIGGNMRILFPEARVVGAGSPAETWPRPNGAGSCLLLWEVRDAGSAADDRNALRRYLADELRGSPDAAHREGSVEARLLGSETREYRLQFALYDAPNGDCR